MPLSGPWFCGCRPTVRIIFLRRTCPACPSLPTIWILFCRTDRRDMPWSIEICWFRQDVMTGCWGRSPYSFQSFRWGMSRPRLCAHLSLSFRAGFPQMICSCLFFCWPATDWWSRSGLPGLRAAPYSIIIFTSSFYYSYKQSSRLILHDTF